MTGQGILLVGMMTEAVVTPWLSDRDLALQNVRYVLNAAGGLTEDFHPPHDGLIQTRARQVLGEAVDLLDTIVSDTATRDVPAAAARRHRRRHLRLDEAPAHRGKGLDGVVGQGRRVRQPRDRPARGRGHPMTRRRDAHDAQRRMEHAAADELSLLETGPIVRPYGDTTGDGMVQISFTLPLPHDKRAEGAALQLAAKMGMEPALLVHAKAMGPHFTFFVVYGSVTHLVDVARGRGRRARVPAAHRPRRSTPRSRSGCAASWSSSAPASAPTPTPSASTPSSTSRASPARRAWSTTAR